MAGKAWEGTQLLPENRTTNDIVRSSKLDGTGGNGFYIDAVNIALRDIQRTLNQAQALLASSGSAITAGQGYIIDNGGVLQLPTGISLMRVRGINLPSGVKGFDPNAEAYITALATYVPCTYDVGTNKINVEVRALIRVTQTGTSDPVLTVIRNEITGVTFNPSYVDVGSYAIDPSIGLSTIFNSIITQISGTQVIGEVVTVPFAFVGSFYDETNDRARIGTQVLDSGTATLVPTDGILSGKTVTITCILYN